MSSLICSLSADSTNGEWLSQSLANSDTPFVSTSTVAQALEALCGFPGVGTVVLFGAGRNDISGGGDRLEWLLELRASGVNAGIIYLCNDNFERIQALKWGADQAEPIDIDPAEIEARAAAISRMVQGALSGKIGESVDREFPGVQVLRSGRRVSFEGQSVVLNENLFRLAEILARHRADCPVPMASLRQHVRASYSRGASSESMVRYMLTNLRKSLDAGFDGRIQIRSARREGYYLETTG